MEEQNIYANRKQKDTDIAKCPQCGSNLIFNPETQGLYCEHCGFQKEIPAEKTEELIFNVDAKFETWSNETHVARCTNCGAEEIIQKNEISITCPFCGTSSVIQTKELSGQKPNGIVPFKLTKNEAAEKVKVWKKKKILAPRKFKDSSKPENIKGVYSPAFTYDADTDSTYTGRLGKYYTVTRRVNGKTITERKIRYFNISGSFGCIYDEVMIQASSSISQDTLSKIRPFDSNNSLNYRIEYLFGYSANQYAKDGIECWKQADVIIREKIKRGILAKYSYDTVDSLKVSTTYLQITHKYLLLPIYVGHFDWHKKLYNFFINGFNGKVTGKVPVSALKVLIIVVSILILIGTIFGVYLLSKNG
ncbi:hypothetical protein LJC17_01155 [Acholeplasma sp. OttesenSCG-928-E16]|nr:hypothetical protein [Acholeplasma sp. OttesenSCG-928-E16]